MDKEQKLTKLKELVHDFNSRNDTEKFAILLMVKHHILKKNNERNLLRQNFLRKKVFFKNFHTNRFPACCRAKKWRRMSWSKCFPASASSSFADYSTKVSTSPLLFLILYFNFIF